MSWRDAPLYVETHDLALWVLQRAQGWPDREGGALASLTVSAACELVSTVALALTFPASRQHHLEQSDHAIVRLRELLRLARDLGLLSPGGLRFAAGRLDTAGRMLGGWRKRTKAS